MATSAQKVDPRIVAFRDSYIAAVEYARPHWELYARLYALWKGKPFAELAGTFSQINLNFFHAAVQDRLPKLYDNIFSTTDFVDVRATEPVAQFTAPAAKTWLTHLLREKIRIQQSIMPTLQTVLIGGTAYRMPHVQYVQEGGKLEKYITSRDVDFFHVLPAPLGGHVNPDCQHSENAVPWVMIVDWWTEDYIRAQAKAGVLDADGVRRLLDMGPQDIFLENQYRNVFATVGKLEYQSEDSWRMRLRSAGGIQAADGKTQAGLGHNRRRVVHWWRRDRHLIIGEDCCVLYDEPNPDGVIPLAKYTICPDQNNWFGISYLQILEDILKAQVMSFNLRMDNLYQMMFPRTLVSNEWVQAFKYTDNDLVPRPYSILRYNKSGVGNGISVGDLIHTDRGEPVPAEAFMEEDRIKAHIQKIGGASETTTSLGDVIGNKTSGGVTAILGELAGRVYMESFMVEQGFRDECALLLKLGRKHVIEPEAVTIPDAEDGFQWGMVDPDDLDQEYSVVTNGTRNKAERDQLVQRMLAFYPLWKGDPSIDQYELARQSVQVSGAMPEPEKLLVAPETTAAYGAPAEPDGDEAMRPGGMASGQDMMQRVESTRNSTSPGNRNPRGGK